MQQTAAKNTPRYWQATRQPLACLLFLLPLLSIYEAGVLWFGAAGAELVRNGADNWMRGALVQLGFEQLYLLPVLVLGFFLLWQIWEGYPWRVSTPTLAGMCVESALFALGLVALSWIQEFFYQGWMAPTAQFVASGDPHANLMLLVAFLGAGVYEEVLFRLGLLPVCYALFRLFALPRTASVVGAIVVTSAVFSWAHYVGPYADTFDTFSFLFRFLAGVVFASLFVFRGFGIAVGAHALYDIVVGILA